MSKVKRWGIALGIVVTFGLVAGHDVAPETVSVVPVVDDTRSTRIHENDADQLDDRTESSLTSRVSTSKEGKVRAGACRKFEGKITVYSCVPLFSPNGSPVKEIEEDGSALYRDGFTYDGDDMTFTAH